MLTRNLLTSLLRDQVDVDVLASADRWVDESLEQIDLGEEPTLAEFMAYDDSAAKAFRATMYAIQKEISKGSERNDGQIETLISRFVVACSHKAVTLDRQQAKVRKGLA